MHISIVLYDLWVAEHNLQTQRNARVAQLVERDLAKVEAAGSSPVSRFLKRYPIGYLFFRLKTWTRGAAEFEVSEDIKPSSVGAIGLSDQ